MNISFIKPENPVGSHLTAYISTTLPLNIYIGGKQQICMKRSVKAVTEPLLPVTVLYRHPNGTANMVMGKV